MKHTLTMVNTTLTEPKTALAGVTLEISFARFIASMDTFNVERRPPRPLGRWELVAIVETGSEYGKRRGTGTVLSQHASWDPEVVGPIDCMPSCSSLRANDRDSNSLRRLQETISSAVNYTLVVLRLAG